MKQLLPFIVLFFLLCCNEDEKHIPPPKWCEKLVGEVISTTDNTEIRKWVRGEGISTTCERGTNTYGEKRFLIELRPNSDSLLNAKVPLAILAIDSIGRDVFIYYPKTNEMKTWKKSDQAE